MSLIDKSAFINGCFKKAKQYKVMPKAHISDYLPFILFFYLCILSGEKK